MPKSQNKVKTPTHTQRDKREVAYYEEYYVVSKRVSIYPTYAKFSG